MFKKKETAFFLNRNGTRLTDRSIRRIVIKYARAIGVEGSDRPSHTQAYLCKSSSSGRCGSQSDSGAFRAFIPVNNAEIYASGHYAPDGYL